MKNHSSYLTIEEIVSLPEYQDTAVSENGKRIAYISKTPNWSKNTYQHHVWVYDCDTDKKHPVTIGEKESLHPRWSPNSKILAYLSPAGKGDEKQNQIFLLFLEHNKSIQVSSFEQGVKSFIWAPDGKGIFFIADRPESDEIKERKKRYGDFLHIDQDFRYNGLYFLDIEYACNNSEALYDLPADLQGGSVATNNITPLINSKNIQIQHYDISPNGEKIIFNAAPTPKLNDISELEVYIFDIQTKNLQKLNITPLHTGKVLFSHDGNKICYGRYVDEKFVLNNITLEIYDLHSGETSQPIEIDENITPFRWMAEGILITWQEKTNFRIGMLSEAGKLTSLMESSDIVVTHLCISSDGKNISYVKANSQQVPEVYVNDNQITKRYQYYEGRKRSHKEVIQWETNDGTEIEGILSKPVDFDSSRRYPLVLAVHGGPTSTSLAIPTNNKNQPIEQFVEKGFLVLEPNYRGSAGYGEEFRKANYRNLGLGDYEDVISGVDALVKKGIVDAEKVGILGWSQGGYISAFCATYSNRFKAASVGAGISNWQTYYVNTDITNFTRFFFSETPWNDEEIYRKTSPITYINNASTPTLIQHGENDQRVPVPNAYELYRGLKDVGVETDLVIFKGMAHGADKPGFHRAILQQNLDWFSRYILGETIEDGCY